MNFKLDENFMMIGKTSQLGIMSPERQLWIVEVDRVRVHQQSEN